MFYIFLGEMLLLLLTERVQKRNTQREEIAEYILHLSF